MQGDQRNAGMQTRRLSGRVSASAERERRASWVKAAEQAVRQTRRGLTDATKTERGVVREGKTGRRITRSRKEGGISAWAAKERKKSGQGRSIARHASEWRAAPMRSVQLTVAGTIARIPTIPRGEFWRSGGGEPGSRGPKGVRCGGRKGREANWVGES